MRPPKPEGLIRHFWPSLISCPKCADQTPRKVARRGRRQSMACTKCPHTWIVIARYAEIDMGGGHSEIQPL
jgi:ssDNA-binding Zn-finger/Zn-ribbon topoisomerase 1